jgi:PAS domain S-box-containing protein
LACASFFILLTLLCANHTLAERLPIKVYTAADGLPRDHINRIVQDSKGFLWFCTSEGLSRFDGYKFTNYGGDQGLPGRDVNDFLESRTGVYWVATSEGLCRFIADPASRAGARTLDSAQRFVAYYPGEQAPGRTINVLCEDRAGTIWCGTDGGLFRLDQVDGQWSFSFIDIIRPTGATNILAVTAIIEDRQGSLWIGAESGLYRRRTDGQVERYSAEEGLPKNGAARLLLEDRVGRVWVGTPYGLYQLVADPKPHHSVVAGSYGTKDGLSNNWITSLCQSSDGKLWAGNGPALSEFKPNKNPASNEDGGRFQTYTPANGLTDSAIITIAEDRDRNLWMGTYVSGAMRLAANAFTTYNQTDGLGGVTIASIFESREGDLVVSEERRLNRFDGERFAAARLAFPNGITYAGWGWYQTTFQDREGEWWMPTGQGLVRYPKLNDLKQITYTHPKVIYTTRDGLSSDNIFRLFEDSRGDIWIGSVDNPKTVLTRWERATETFHRYTSADGIPEVAPTAFCEDASGNLWIGLYVGGLLRYTAGRFTSLTKADGVPSGMVRGLYLDHAHRLWIATGEGGAARVDEPGAEHPSFVTYSTADGLSSNQATCVTEDQWGMIYVGTGRGVDKLDPGTGHIKHYSMADGLANSFINVGFRQHDGSLWFGTLQGLSRLVPQPERPTSPPPILITALRIAGVAYPLSELGASAVVVPQLGAGQNNIQIEFAGLGLAVGESLRYQYKLEGASSDWSAPTDQRTVSYPNLAPGSYGFLVRAVSADGTMSESPATVSFQVLPPIWRRWWFVAIAAFFIAAAILSLERYRAARVRALGESENRYRALAETASDAIFTIDEAGEIMFVNPAAEQVFDRSAAEMIGHKIGDLIPGYLRSLELGSVDGDEAPDLSWEVRELFGIHKSGVKIPLELSFGTFARDSRRFVTVIARDVTERKRAEEDLRRSREERLAELERVRRRIATDLHDDIGSSLTQISILSEVIRQKSGNDESPASEPLSMIARSSRELVDAMSDIVWAINPQKDHLTDLTQRMRRFASDVFTARNIEFNLRLPPVDRNVKLGANLRREVFLIFKESINNMVRHSSCTNAEIEFQLAEDSMLLTLNDNGKGFDTARQSDGHGLSSMRERARDIGGRFEITSSEGRGTGIRLEVPLDRASRSDIQYDIC